MSEQLQQTEPLGFLDEAAIDALISVFADAQPRTSQARLRIALRTFLVRARQNYSQG